MLVRKPTIENTERNIDEVDDFIDCEVDSENQQESMSSAYPDSEKEDSDQGPVSKVTKDEIEKQALLAKAVAYLESLLESSGSSSDEEVIEATTVIVQYEENEEV